MKEPKTIEEVQDTPEGLDDTPIIILPDSIDIAWLQTPESAPSIAEPERPPPRAKAPQQAPSITKSATKLRVKPGLSRAKKSLYLIGSFSGVAGVLGLIGFVAFVIQRGYLANYYPSPGALTEAHGQVARIPKKLNCNGCHSLTGLINGCLGCHAEIEGQLAGEYGFHNFMLKGKDVDCSQCHHEHLGSEMLLVNTPSWRGKGPTGFTHPHVDFQLTCKHTEQACSSCHEDKRRADIVLPLFPDKPRKHTFLGMKQDCVSCHEDIHSGGMSENCESCHDQAAFRPAALFDHGRFFPLEGGHSRVACNQCHRIPDPTNSAPASRLPFADVRGTTCVECHDSPHRTAFAADCIECHGSSPESWSAGRRGVTPKIHASTGFVLSPAHARVDCVKCHKEGGAYEQRFQNPSQPGASRRQDACDSCHQDAHDGQFTRKGMICVDCHGLEQFKPQNFGIQRHENVFPLLGAHEQVNCESCHKSDSGAQVRRFVGTSHECKTCHQDPHAGQFEAAGLSCSTCHDPRRFVPASFDHTAHENVFPLAGAHRAVPCRSCHEKDAKTGVRHFADTPKSCKSCHSNPHGDQFARELNTGDCSSCHREGTESFAIGHFDHESCVGFPLVGAHANAKCNHCHVERDIAVGPELVSSRIRIFRNTSRRCSSCHRDIHLGQFQVQADTDCARCHDPSARWADLRFNHNQQARFQLDGVHAKVPCGSCHPAVSLPNGNSVKLFKPRGTNCFDCHTVISE